MSGQYDTKICVVGLGYVGLPLAVEFGKKYHVTGFDVKHGRVEELIKGIDRTLEVDSKNLKSSTYLTFTSNIEEIRDCTFFIVSVPTPIDEHKNAHSSRQARLSGKC
jgi:UDP-N-acetyl-D-galactosamine dehydrogenase